MRNKILSLLVLLLTAASGAWAEEPKVYTEPVALNQLKQGDILAQGFSIINDGHGWQIFFTANCYKLDGVKGETTYGIGTENIKYYGANGAVNADDYQEHNFTFSPLLKDGTDGNAWEVTEVNTGFPYVAVVGINYEAPIEVTTNAASEGAAFTEASFNMPAFDATAEYELVRDMSVQMTAQVGDGTEAQPRYRVKKAQVGDGYEPADMAVTDIPGLFSVTDGLENNKVLTLATDYYCLIYKLDEQTQQPTGDGVVLTDFDFAPGLYAIKAFGQDDSYYDGETALSNTFKLYEGYEVEVPAGEFITYYKDENLYVDDADAQLYTITSVGTETATATQLTIAAAYTPILVKNTSEETKTFLLIPTTDEGDNVDYAAEFVGTLEDSQILASSEALANYAFNGKQFVWVMNAIPVAANKAWLSISNSNARSIKLVFGDATSVEKLKNSRIEELNGDWYDLNGRKVNAPSKKGVYILNGRKVVIK